VEVAAVLVLERVVLGGSQVDRWGYLEGVGRIDGEWIVGEGDRVRRY